MNVALEIHLGFAFFVFLLALFIGWVQLGRGVMVAVITVEILIGAVVALVAGAAHLALPRSIWIHIVGGVLALLAYFVGRRVFDRSPGNLPAALALSFAGFVLVIFTIWYGSHVTLTHGL
jgi:hypothetical protein